MSIDRTDSCAEISAVLPELALGVLTGRDRAAALAHIESCSRCADELEQLARAADAVVRVAPELEPPVGFEGRLFSRMGVTGDAAPALAPTPVPSPNRRFRTRPRTWILASAAAVVALIVGLGLGWSASTPSTNRTQATGQHAANATVSAALREGGRPVGRVSISGGSSPWMNMTLDDASVEGAVTCRVVTGDGVTHVVGTFTVKQGYGAWGAPLPVSSRDVRRALVVSARGTVIATAALG